MPDDHGGPSDLGHGKHVISASPDSQVEVGPWNVDGKPSLAICGDREKAASE